MNLPTEFKKNVMDALLDARKNFKGNDSAFARQFKIYDSTFTKLNKSKNSEKLLSDEQLLNIGYKLGVTSSNHKWKIAKTTVFSIIEEEILFCKNFSKARIFIDQCGIGKTFTAKYLSKAVKNCFYIDASQAKSKQQFIRLIATTLGIDEKGKYTDVIRNIKYYLLVLEKPIIIIDEAGDLDYSAFLEIKELWNATENTCGWYMIGAEGFKEKIERGINHKKVGYREIFSRFSEKFSSSVPIEQSSKIEFYRKLIYDVLSVNSENKEIIPSIVNKCLIQQNGEIGGLRRAESLLILNT